MPKLSCGMRCPAGASAMGSEIGRIRPTNVFERAGESRMTPPASSISSCVGGRPAKMGGVRERLVHLSFNLRNKLIPLCNASSQNSDLRVAD